MDSRLQLDSEKRNAVRRYVADLNSLRRLDRFAALQQEGFGVREAASQMDVDPKVLYRDAERWDRPLMPSRDEDHGTLARGPSDHPTGVGDER